MLTTINKDTKIYCSFSKNAGNKGCEFFNKMFYQYNIDAIYKSFSVDNIEDAIKSAKILKFSGCAVAMPYKKQVMNLIDILDESAIKSQSINTILFDNNQTKGYNTDYYGAQSVFIICCIAYPQIVQQKNYKTVYVIGNGGLGGAVRAAITELGFEVNMITRKEWSKLFKIKNSIVYNCTPLSLTLDKSNGYIDCLIGTKTGDLLHKYQSYKQFELYTGITINDV